MTATNRQPIRERLVQRVHDRVGGFGTLGDIGELLEISGEAVVRIDEAEWRKAAAEGAKR